MNIDRSCGILMHISSLPSKFGIGDLGLGAKQWVDFLDRTGTKYWQILPLNPTGYGNSPYQGLSSVAGNPLFIDLEDLRNQKLLEARTLSSKPFFSRNRVNFTKVIQWKMEVLKKAFVTLSNSKNISLKRALTKFAKVNASWLNDYSLFMAIREKYDLASWSEWPGLLKKRDKQALDSFEKMNKKEIEFHKFLQFIFFRQWKDLKTYANKRGIYIIGDIPIFMGFDSSDVWANPHLFQMDKDLQPTFVAGVPPDFFSKTGQLWGNPLYDWKKHKQQNFFWWKERIRESLKTVDCIRLDHFRGFAGYFSIPAHEKTAENGKWKKGPGKTFFDSLANELDDFPFIAEDLGVITQDVIDLRERYQLPGMRVFQFAFSADEDKNFLPHNYPVFCVAYTGTHDNNTIKGWFNQAKDHEKAFCSSYMGKHVRNISHEMIRTLWASRAFLTITPMQDFLKLDQSARMNTPATAIYNWEWRMRSNAIRPRLVKWIKEINITYNRVNSSKNWEAKDFFRE